MQNRNKFAYSMAMIIKRAIISHSVVSLSLSVSGPDPPCQAQANERETRKTPLNAYCKYKNAVNNDDYWDTVGCVVCSAVYKNTHKAKRMLCSSLHAIHRYSSLSLSISVSLRNVELTLMQRRICLCAHLKASAAENIQRQKKNPPEKLIFNECVTDFSYGSVCALSLSLPPWQPSGAYPLPVSFIYLRSHYCRELHNGNNHDNP